VLDIVPTVNWYPKVARMDYSVGLSAIENSLDDRDQSFYENYVCGAEHNYTGYCNPVVDKLIHEQSMVSTQENRQKLVWGIERKLAEDDAAPIIFYGRVAYCWQPQVKGLYHYGQQHVQRLAHGRRLARLIIQILNQGPDNGPRNANGR
jgi:peptide/nickel transport system substrate-binding protein